MTPVSTTTSITYEETTYEVANLSQEAQYTVQILDSCRQDEYDAMAALIKSRAALTELQNKLLQQIQESVATPPIGGNLAE